MVIEFSMHVPGTPESADAGVRRISFAPDEFTLR
jgi:hypothetical protein